MVGYERQMDAGIAIALSVVDGISKSALIFGFPGNGKTLFPNAVAYRLKGKEEAPFSLVMIECDAMPTEVSDPEELLGDLRNAVDEALQLQPVILCFDEIDHLCPHISEVPPSRGTFSAWMRRLLKGEGFQANHALVIGTTNYPPCIEPSVKRNFQIPIYFEPTPREVAKKIIKKRLIDSQRVARKYVDNFKSLHRRPMGAEIMSACLQVKKTDTDLESLSEDEIISSLMASTPIPPSDRELRAYEKENADIIKMSEDIAIPYWLDIYKRTAKRKE